MWEKILNWLKDNMQSCFYKEHFGVECPGCGTQRALLLLLEGDVWGSLKMYPPLALVLATAIYLILHLLFRFKRGGRILKYLAISTASVIFLSYLYRVILHL